MERGMSAELNESGELKIFDCAGDSGNAALAGEALDQIKRFAAEMGGRIESRTEIMLYKDLTDRGCVKIRASFCFTAHSLREYIARLKTGARA